MASFEHSTSRQPGLETATLGGGCFWCLEAVFQELKGVQKVESGYMGGKTLNPTYKDVCSGMTGHAEVIRITFDPQNISYREMLQIFFVMHDPTTLNRQGNDTGTQYRSVVFYNSPEQQQVALSVMREVEEKKIWDSPIVTQLQPEEIFYKAEDYHQGYFNQNSQQPYCQLVVAPKVAKLRKKFIENVK
jgi:peptide-methionine (S)-S-oxide reductase